MIVETTCVAVVLDIIVEVLRALLCKRRGRNES